MYVYEQNVCVRLKWTGLELVCVFLEIMFLA